MKKKAVTNWGLFPKIEAEVFQTSDVQVLSNYLCKDESTVIARGNGRCYGDSSLGKNIFDTKSLNKFISFNHKDGVIHCQSGVLLSEILEVIVPQGYFLPVTPGTKFITVGGAVGADVHGKNHHVDGCFSDHVLFIDLLNEVGELIRCSSSENPELFWSTCGGMGLTGIVISVCFKLKPINNAFINQTIIKAKNLQEIMQLFDEYEHMPYSVAWIDCLQKEQIGRSHLIVGDHAPIDSKLDLTVKKIKSINVPFMFPKFTLNKLTVKIFNALYYRKQRQKVYHSQVYYEGFFYPLDSILNWNRIYGSNGFTQYQFVIPMANAYEALSDILSKIAHSGEGSFLAVLKKFGKANEKAIMSFPIEGYTLALDFKINRKVLKLLDELDELVLKYGGRLYLAKDARMHPDFFHQSYQKKVTKVKKFQSLQSLRLNI